MGLKQFVWVNMRGALLEQKMTWVEIHHSEKTDTLGFYRGQTRALVFDVRTLLSCFIFAHRWDTRDVSLSPSTHDLDGAPFIILYSQTHLTSFFRLKE